MSVKERLAGSAKPSPMDISREKYREYVYSGDRVFRIVNPASLYITDSGSHRVIDIVGVCHRPEKGYVGIRWDQEGGFDF